MIQAVDIFVHGSKESNWDLGKKLGLDEEALSNFMYTAYEVKLTYNLNTETGETYLIAVDGLPVVRAR